MLQLHICTVLVAYINHIDVKRQKYKPAYFRKRAVCISDLSYPQRITLSCLLHSVHALLITDDSMPAYPLLSVYL
jgi:hypothetical protein